ncbi:hypothetical protein HHS_04430 [Candidatus Pantoea carbekii]|uniref:Zinc metalloprotease n=1 Tax=Candidatus Pantoea carbekii TaxID=1235990 RepID=U3U9D4_9GAMM|nr:hypothetical protein HHS_04430 [Candidatus Pantoea carbekii]
MLHILWNFIIFVITLGVLITIHELGHFLVARLIGVKVVRFSIGFGKKLFSFKDRQDTEYIIALIPIGGYVKMLDEHEQNMSYQVFGQSFNKKTLSQRAAIIAAGPIANFIFSIFIYWIVFSYGMPSIRPIIHGVVNGSIAEKAHLTSGMEVKAVDDVKTPDWNSVRMVLLKKIGNSEITFTVSQFNKIQKEKKILNLRRYHFKPKSKNVLLFLGILSHRFKIQTTLAYIHPNSPAIRAGLKVGDKIVKVDGKLLTNWQLLATILKKSFDTNIELEIERSGKIIKKLVKLEKQSNYDNKNFLGVIPQIIIFPNQHTIIRKCGYFDAIYKAHVKVWQLIKLNVSILRKLITRDIALNNFGGAISIAKGAVLSAKYGLIYYLIFLAMISINIGIINLFPLPVLDGGCLLFLIIEKIKGESISIRVKDFSYRISLILLVVLMGFAIFNDFSRLY